MLYGIVALFSFFLAAAQALAQDCARPAANAIPGTLAAPQSPCAPAAPSRIPERDRRPEAPGVFRSGNTTIHIGGAIKGETTVRGR